MIISADVTKRKNITVTDVLKVAVLSIIIIILVRLTLGKTPAIISAIIIGIWFAYSLIKELSNTSEIERLESKFLNEERKVPETTKAMVFVPDNEYYEKIKIPEDMEAIDLNILVHISYCDFKGNKSTRRITILKMYNDGDGDVNLYSYCHEKSEDRTFKLSRVTQMADIETGEIIKDYVQYFTSIFNDTPIGKITAVFQQYKSETLCFAFLARADGVLRKPEREIIRRFINNKSVEILDQEIIDDMIRNTYCSIKEFRTALKTTATTDLNHRLEVINTASEIILSDNKADPLEIGALDLVKKYLSEKKVKLKKSTNRIYEKENGR